MNWNKKEKGVYFQRGLRGTNLEPLPLHQPLEALYGSAGRVQDDLGQGGDLQSGVRPLRPMDQHRRTLPETRRRNTASARHLLSMGHLSLSPPLLAHQEAFTGTQDTLMR